MDETDDYLAAELKAIIDHICLTGILEFKVEYTYSDQS